MGVDYRTGGYSYHSLDLAIPGRGFDFRFERWHDSLRTFSFQGGWRFDWDERLELDESDGSVRYYSPGETQSRFVKNPDGTYSPAASWIYSTLEVQPDGRFLLTTKGRQKRYFHPESGKLLVREDTNGNTMTFTWNDAGQVQTITDASGRTVTITWSALQSTITVTDWTGRQLVYTHDSGYFITSYTDPEGNTTTYNDGTGPVANSFNGVGKVEYPDGAVLNVYPAGQIPLANKVGRVVHPNGLEQKFDYDWTNRKTTITEDGRVSVYEWDTVGNLVKYTDPINNVWTWTYNANNQVTQMVDPNLATVSRTYDSKGNLLTETDAKGNTWTYEYDPVFNHLVRTVAPPPFGYIREYEHDPTTGALTAVKGSTGSLYGEFKYGEQKYGFDPTKKVSFEYYADATRKGLLKKVTDQNGNSVTLDYDGSANLTKVTNGLLKDWLFGHDAVGNQASVTDPLGHTTRMTYDRNNRVVTVTTPLGNTTRTQYDSMGRVVTVTDPMNRGNSFSHSVMGELLEVVDAAGGAVTMTYDLLSNLLSQSDANGNTYAFAYDKLNRHVRTTDPLGQVTTLAYDPYCGTMTQTDAEGIRTSLTRDVKWTGGPR